MLRSLAKTCIACAYHWSGTARWLKGSDAAKIPFIAGYHRVVSDFNSSARRTVPAMLISSKTFEKHLDLLARRFSFVSLDDIGFHLENERSFQRPAAAITFDDGYADVYHNAFPILRRKGIPAAVFVVTDLVGSKRRQVHDRLFSCLSQTDNSRFSTMTGMLTGMSQEEVLNQIDVREAGSVIRGENVDEFMPLSWEMIEEMQQSNITFGSHTKSHVLLTSERLDEVERQLKESKQVLETRLKRRIDHFAYPDGRFNRSTLAAVSNAGYRFAYTICRQRDSQFPLLTISRKILWEQACTNVLGQLSPSVMRCHTDGIFETGSACEHIH
jgi:peptidoglycan/xylan/chitin deacetylase (PgdA/CDA1 family)